MLSAATPPGPGMRTLTAREYGPPVTPFALPQMKLNWVRPSTRACPTWTSPTSQKSSQ